MRSSDEFLTFAKAIAWVCTRKEIAVQAVENPQTVDALKLQVLRSKFGQKVARARPRFEGPIQFGRTEDIGLSQGDYCSGTEALQQLVEAVLTGKIFTPVRHATTGIREPIPEAERLNLEFYISPDDPIYSFGFRSKVSGTCRYIEPWLSEADVRRLFPAPKQRSIAAAEGRIHQKLLEITASGPVTKANAIQACKAVPGFKIRVFGRAWRTLSPERKRGRGQHGPRRIKPNS